jgi:hypothetical protein
MSMTDPPPYPETNDDTGAEPERGPAAGTPRWMSVLGIAIVVLVVLMLFALHLSGGVGPR